MKRKYTGAVGRQHRGHHRTVQTEPTKGQLLNVQDADILALYFGVEFVQKMMSHSISLDATPKFTS